MGDFFNNIKVSKNPIKTTANQKKAINKKKKKCNNCNSENTVCVFYDAFGCIIGWTVEEEYFCNDCGYYTLYTSEYDS